MKKFTLILLALLALAPLAEAQAKKKAADGKAASKKAAAGPEAMALQDKYYERVQIPTPPGEVVEVSSIALLPFRLSCYAPVPGRQSKARLLGASVG